MKILVPDADDVADLVANHKLTGSVLVVAPTFRQAKLAVAAVAKRLAARPPRRDVDRIVASFGDCVVTGMPVGLGSQKFVAGRFDHLVMVGQGMPDEYVSRFFTRGRVLAPSPDRWPVSASFGSGL